MYRSHSEHQSLVCSKIALNQISFKNSKLCIKITRISYYVAINELNFVF
jgi:hypothetical protein